MLSALLDQIALKPISGRIMARELANGKEAIVGVLHLPADFTPKEGALYLAMYGAEGTFHVIPSVIDADLPEEYQGMGISAALEGSCWRKTNKPGTLTVRFVEAFPDSNGWSIYGAGNQQLLPADRFHRGHAFMELSHGTLHQLSAVDDANGHAMEQLLSQLPIWPDANGAPHTVPAMEARWRQAYYDMAVLRARFGAGELTEEQLREAMKADPKIAQISDHRIDREFCRYLAELRSIGALQLERPLTAVETKAREDLALPVLVNATLGEEVCQTNGLRAVLKL
jgi:hypothetical protein